MKSCQLGDGQELEELELEELDELEELLELSELLEELELEELLELDELLEELELEELELEELLEELELDELLEELELEELLEELELDELLEELELDELLEELELDELLEELELDELLEELELEELLELPKLLEELELEELLDEELLDEELLELLLDDDAQELSTAVHKSAEHWQAETVNGAVATPVLEMMAQLPEFPIFAPYMRRRPGQPNSSCVNLMGNTEESKVLGRNAHSHARSAASVPHSRSIWANRGAMKFAYTVPIGNTSAEEVDAPLASTHFLLICMEHSDAANEAKLARPLALSSGLAHRAAHAGEMTTPVWMSSPFAPPHTSGPQSQPVQATPSDQSAPCSHVPAPSHPGKMTMRNLPDQPSGVGG